MCQPQALQVCGKWKGWGALVAAVAVPYGCPSRLLVFNDATTDQQVLVDTGSAYSIIPH